MLYTEAVLESVTYYSAILLPCRVGNDHVIFLNEGEGGNARKGIARTPEHLRYFPAR